MILLLLCLAVTACLAGLREGMIMIQEDDEQYEYADTGGVRCHAWFKIYHALRIAVGIGCGIIGWYVISHFALTVAVHLLLCQVVSSAV